MKQRKRKSDLSKPLRLGNQVREARRAGSSCIGSFLKAEVVMITMAIDPMQGKFFWAISDGQQIIDRGCAFDVESLLKIAHYWSPASVRICCGWKTEEILHYCQLYGWTPCKLFASDRTPLHTAVLYLRDNRNELDKTEFGDVEYMAAYCA
jgi:hypothetical protein